jgi:hypothetical protein
MFAHWRTGQFSLANPSIFSRALSALDAFLVHEQTDLSRRVSVAVTADQVNGYRHSG